MPDEIEALRENALAMVNNLSARVAELEAKLEEADHWMRYWRAQAEFYKGQCGDADE